MTVLITLAVLMLGIWAASAGLTQLVPTNFGSASEVVSSVLAALVVVAAVWMMYLAVTFDGTYF